MTDQQLVIENFQEKIEIFTHVVKGEYIEKQDFALANTKIPTDTFNILLSKTKHIENMDSIRKNIEKMRDEKYPLSAWINHQYLSDDWQLLMKEYHLHEAERNALMKRKNTMDINMENMHKLAITQVTSREDFHAYKMIFLSLFEGTLEKLALETYFERYEQVNDYEKCQMFIGQVDGVVVSTGLLINTTHSYGIYDVMTREDARGKGYGSEMFQYLLTQTKDKQKPIVLQASDDGKNIYKRFGFEEVGEIIVFE